MALGTGINISGRTAWGCCLCKPDGPQYTLHKYIFIGPGFPAPHKQRQKESDWGHGGNVEEGRGNRGKICWVINYPSLCIHNFLLNKYANTAYLLPLPGSAVGMTVNLQLDPWGGGPFGKWARAKPASLLSLICHGFPGPLGPASSLRFACTRPVDCALFISPLGISSFLPCYRGWESGAGSLVLASVYFFSLISCPFPSWLLCFSRTGLQPNPLHLRTFALAVSLPGMLCSHGQLFLVIQV